MKPFYLTIVADQEGDPNWDINATFNAAAGAAKEMQETAFDKPKIYEVTPVSAEDFESFDWQERDWRP